MSRAIYHSSPCPVGCLKSISVAILLEAVFWPEQSLEWSILRGHKFVKSLGEYHQLAGG